MVVFVLVIISHASGVSGEDEVEFYRGTVLSVKDHEPEQELTTLEQEVEVRITSGPFRGRTVIISNTYLEEDIHQNIYLQENMSIILAATVVEGDEPEFSFYDVIRDRGLYALFGVFIFLLLLVGRGQGIKTIITLTVTGLVIGLVILPLILRGYDPIVVTTVSAMVIIIFTLILIGGFNAKSLSAMIGTFIGVAVAGILAFWTGRASFLTGFGSEEAQMLLFIDQPIDIRGLLFAGIIIGSLGAVTDVGMSVASAAAEIREVNPEISHSGLVKASMNVGRDIMGTMANTLLLAYVGGAFPLLLILVHFHPSLFLIFNMDVIATELVRGLAGSIGLIISIPVTAFIAGVSMGKS